MEHGLLILVLIPFTLLLIFAILVIKLVLQDRKYMYSKYKHLIKPNQSSLKNKQHGNKSEKSAA